jgi:hypothetical protein
MRRYLSRLRELKALICRHKTTSLVVKEGFEMHEELEQICVKCKTRFPLEKERVITLYNGKLHYHNKSVEQLSKVEKKSFNTYIKILKHMEALNISLKLAQKLIESSKIKDFEISYTAGASLKPIKVSRFHFNKEAMPIEQYLQSVKAKEARISLQTRENTMCYNLRLDHQLKAAKS